MAVSEGTSGKAGVHVFVFTIGNQIVFIHICIVSGSFGGTIQSTGCPIHTSVQFILCECIGTICRTNGHMFFVGRICDPVPGTDSSFQALFCKVGIRQNIFIDEIRMGKHCRHIRCCKVRAQVSFLGAGSVIRSAVQGIFNVDRTVLVIGSDIERAVFIRMFQLEQHIQFPFDLAENRRRIGIPITCLIRFENIGIELSEFLREKFIGKQEIFDRGCCRRNIFPVISGIVPSL